MYVLPANFFLIDALTCFANYYASYLLPPTLIWSCLNSHNKSSFIKCCQTSRSVRERNFFFHCTHFIGRLKGVNYLTLCKRLCSCFCWNVPFMGRVIAIIIDWYNVYFEVSLAPLSSREDKWKLQKTIPLKSIESGAGQWIQQHAGGRTCTMDR